MKFYIIGSEDQLKVVQLKFPSVEAVLWHEGMVSTTGEMAVLWDFQAKIFAHPHIIVGFQVCFVQAIYHQLLVEIARNGSLGTVALFGMNAWPGMFERPLLELSDPRNQESTWLAEILGKHEVKYTIVQDRVGMVTPRILSMIINEAYYTLMEGTASKTDIDTSMRMGTNYPFGPFEWSKIIGLKNVFRMLEVLYQDTHDERYKVCPLLKTEYYQSELN